MARQVTCTRKSNPPTGDCTYIIAIGRFPELGGVISRETAIQMIDRDPTAFYVVDPADRSRVYVKVARRGNLRYLRTASNDTPRDNLLQLPSCG